MGLKTQDDEIKGGICGQLHETPMLNGLLKMEI